MEEIEFKKTEIEDGLVEKLWVTKNKEYVIALDKIFNNYHLHRFNEKGEYEILVKTSELQELKEKTKNQEKLIIKLEIEKQET